MGDIEEVSQEEFERDMNNRQQRGRVQPESREVLLQELVDTLHEEDQAHLARYVGQEVTVYRDLTGTIVGIVTDDD